jgi:lipopolysaccharide biosynthesis protein
VKIVTELTRVFRQIVGLPYDTYHKLTATRRYDRLTSKETVIHAGDVARGAKVAIYLVFPKDGLLASHGYAIEYIKSAGYTPFVVSNLPLSDVDRTTLKAQCWQVMERPNVGYDFGGYRDAVLNMKDELECLDRLVILNDSAWFPLGKDTNWLTAAEAMNVDFAGAANSYGIQRVAREVFMDIKWEFSAARRNFHYGSYALSMGPKLLRSQYFVPFWTNMEPFCLYLPVYLDQCILDPSICTCKF